MPRHLKLVSAALLVASCFGPVTEEDYALAYARAYCSQSRECARGYFDHEFSDLEDCEQEVEEDIGDALDVADDLDCEFDDERADECIDRLRTADCEEFYEGRWVDDCIDTWDDCDFNPFG